MTYAQSAEIIRLLTDILEQLKNINADVELTDETG
jgi:hypothetical protein